MRLSLYSTSILIATFVLAQNVVAQSDNDDGSADIPTCAADCVEQTSCGVVTTECVCTSANENFLQSCVTQGCSADDKATSLDALSSFCSSGSDSSDDNSDSTDSSNGSNSSPADPKAKQVPNPNAPRPQVPPKGSFANKAQMASALSLGAIISIVSAMI